MKSSLFNSIYDYQRTLGQQSAIWKYEILEIVSDCTTIREGNQGIIANSEAICEYFKDFSSIDNYPNMLIWETTCHIMADLAGTEKNQIFDHPVILKKLSLDDLCKNAIFNACDELKVSYSSISPSKCYLIGGIAIWNLLLPIKLGGVFPDAEYKDFSSHLVKKIEYFLADYIHINEDQMNKAFRDLKEFAKKCFALDTIFENNKRSEKRP